MQDILLDILRDGSIGISTFLLDHYAEIGMNNNELVLYIQIQKEQSQGQTFPSMEKLADTMGMDRNELYKTIQTLQDKKLMELSQKKDRHNKVEDYYNFDMMYQKLLKLADSSYEEEVEKEKIESSHDLFDQIQLEFGRPLSPIEIESISKWMTDDHYKPELIKLALKEAVLNQAYNLKYMDRILMNWEKKNLTTASQVEKSIGNLHKNDSNNTEEKIIDIPIIKLTK